MIGFSKNTYLILAKGYFLCSLDGRTFYGIDFEDDEGLVEQRTVHILVQGLFVIAAPVEVFHHIAVGREVYPQNAVLVADVGDALYGELIECVE